MKRMPNGSVHGYWATKQRITHTGYRTHDPLIFNTKEEANKVAGLWRSMTKPDIDYEPRQM